jgi:hypothetical protein
MTNASQLSGVAATSPAIAWAVGNYDANSTGLKQTLVERWNG